MAIKTMYFIIKSTHKETPIWEGKSFGDKTYRAKIYFSFSEVATALSSYWFNDFVPSRDDREIKIVQLSEKKKDKLIKENKIRF
jgi:hypothetical protein